MEHFYRITAFLLALVLLCGCVCVTAFAENTSVTYPSYGERGGYLALGDSISRGMCADGTDGKRLWKDSWCNWELRYVTGSYTAQVAEAVGCDTNQSAAADTTFYACCYPGMTLSCVMEYLGLDEKYSSDALKNYREKLLEPLGISQGTSAGLGEGKLAAYAQEAGLITIELGMADVMLNPVFYLWTHWGEADAISVTMALFADGFHYWQTAYPKLLRYLKAHNPGADILLVGMFNVLSEVRLTENSLLPVCNMVSALTASMNACCRLWARQYGVTYVDVSNVETYSGEDGISLERILRELKNTSLDNPDTISDFMPYFHPSQEGESQIARAVLNALPSSRKVTTYTLSRNIVVDLGKLGSKERTLSSVKVNGVPVSGATLANNILTVPYHSIAGRTLAVSTTDPDGKTAAAIYQLAYHPGQGYGAYRMCKTTDAIGMARLISPAAMAERTVSFVHRLLGIEPLSL